MKYVGSVDKHLLKVNNKDAFFKNAAFSLESNFDLPWWNIGGQVIQNGQTSLIVLRCEWLFQNYEENVEQEIVYFFIFQFCYIETSKLIFTGNQLIVFYIIDSSAKERFNIACSFFFMLETYMQDICRYTRHGL